MGCAVPLSGGDAPIGIGIEMHAAGDEEIET
jgi:hypothetical protein